MRIAIGSKNQIKIDAVRLAFRTVWPEELFIFEGAEVLSGVSSQPMSDRESICGAQNRAYRARDLLNADFGVGLEGGLQEIDGCYFDCGWVVIVDRSGHEGIGSTIRILTPPRMLSLIRNGMELGEANDKIFGRKNSKQAEGHFGLMTKNAITRTMGYRDGVISALSQFIHRSLFENKVV